MTTNGTTQVKGEESTDDTERTTESDVTLTDNAAAAAKTSLHEVEADDLAETIDVRAGETVVKAQDRASVLSALHTHRDILERVEGNPTLFDPNGDDTWLRWTRQAIAELEDSTPDEAEGTDGDDGHEAVAPTDDVSTDGGLPTDPLGDIKRTGNCDCCGNTGTTDTGQPCYCCIDDEGGI